MPNSRADDEQHRPPREHATVGEHRETAEHDQLVGDRVEERTRTGRAVAPRHPAVETVARGDREPQPDGEPLRAAVADERERRDRDDDAAEREEVRGRGERVLPEPLRRPAAAAARRPRVTTSTFASRSGPSTPHTVARTIAPGRANTSPVPTRRTTPSISGASRCVRPTRTSSSSVPSTSTSISRPTSAARAAAVIGSCTSEHSRSRSCTSESATLAAHVRGRGAVLAREREEAGPVEPHVVEETEQRLVIGFGLAREARR